ncbi:MAG: molybdopterin-dependent oxidoreductase [Dehalococcoidales bacterium]|nr:molybdopterin-dependent oxidoreductase [Dehalococcoidales bacterium]
MQKRAILGAVAILVIIAAFVTSVLVFGDKSGEVEQLAGVEIREYEGKDLSSVNDFRENSIKGPQHVDLETYRLEVTGLVEEPAVYTCDQVIGDYDSYQKVVRLNCVEGWAVNILWEGVLVSDILDESGVLGEAVTIIFHAEDGYTTSFPVEYIMDNPIIMAYKMNDVTMPAERGFPFQLVAESKWGYKWIKWITRIELSADASYEGYWESRGYANDADLDKGYFGD